jgi:hypothetical protein
LQALCSALGLSKGICGCKKTTWYSVSLMLPTKGFNMKCYALKTTVMTTTKMTTVTELWKRPDKKHSVPFDYSTFFFVTSLQMILLQYVWEAVQKDFVDEDLNHLYGTLDFDDDNVFAELHYDGLRSNKTGSYTSHEW